MITAESDFRSVLKRELEVRCQQSPRYSLRAFARDLKLSPSRLSEVLSGKQGLSRDTAKNIAQTLGFSDPELDLFCDLVDSQHARSKVKKDLARLRLEKQKLDTSFHKLHQDTFQAISDWYHFAIIQLLSLKSAKSDISWMAKALDISVVEADSAVERLKRLGLIEESGGKLRVIKDSLASPSGTPSAAIRKFHRQILEKAILALETQNLQERSCSSIVLTIDKSMVSQAQRWIKNFILRFTKRMNQAPSHDDVYCLSVQFFNLTHTKKLELN